MVEIREIDFSVDEVLAGLKSTRVGAVVFYVGVVRDDGTKEFKKTYSEIAKGELEQLENEAREKFGVDMISIICRQDRLKVGENVLLIGIAAAHRQNAFKAAEFLIDSIKQSASIQTEEIR